MKTALALANLRAGRQQSVCKLLNLIFGLVEQMQGEALRCSRPDARQALELIN